MYIYTLNVAKVIICPIINEKKYYCIFNWVYP